MKLGQVTSNMSQSSSGEGCPSDIFELIQAIPPCRILLNSIQLGENLSVLFCFDFYYIELPQRLKLLQIYVFQSFSIIWNAIHEYFAQVGYLGTVHPSNGASMLCK